MLLFIFTLCKTKVFGSLLTAEWLVTKIITHHTTHGIVFVIHHTPYAIQCTKIFTLICTNSKKEHVSYAHIKRTTDSRRMRSINAIHNILHFFHTDYWLFSLMAKFTNMHNILLYNTTCIYIDIHLYALVIICGRKNNENVWISLQRQCSVLNAHDICSLCTLLFSYFSFSFFLFFSTFLCRSVGISLLE